MGRAIFINYRSDDSHGYGALLYQDLTSRFGADLVFLDCESIPAGADFAEELPGQVRSARVLLAVIGQHWLADGPDGRRLIDDPDDWTRREIAEAFAAGVRVIPVLTDQAELPREADLPPDIAALSRCQYRHLRQRESTSDLTRLVGDLVSLDPELAAAARCRDNPPRPLPPAVELAAPADEHLRLLAKASWHQWTTAANDRRLLHPAPLPIRWRRSSAAVAGPASATAYARFDPLPGLARVSGSRPREGTVAGLHQVYGGLPSGRLLLIGPPGSGKTAAAILLLLDALRYRELASPDEQAQIPVPVLFTLHGWDPDRGDSVTGWMAGKLGETYPVFRSRAGRRAATELLTAGRVAGFLDGLDEIPKSVRPRVLEALADAPFRLVLLSRTAEAVDAADHGPLAGAVAVELQSVRPADAAAYLLEPLVDPAPDSWQAISDHLTTSTEPSAVSEALTTPLALSLLRDVYGPTGPVHELLDASRFPTDDDIRNHLLDHAITAAYTPRPGHPTPRYSVETAHRTLHYLATQLTEHDTSDLAWWHLSAWTPQRSRRIMAAVTNMFTSAIMYGLALGLVLGPAIGFSIGLVFAFTSFCGTFAAASTANFRLAPAMPQRIGRLTYRSTVQSLTFGLTTGLFGGLLAGAPAGLVFGPSAGLVSGCSIGLLSVLVGVVLRGVARHTEVGESSLGPADIWRQDRNAGLMYLPGSGLAILLLAALTARLAPGLASGLASRLWVVLLGGLVVGTVGGLMVTVIAKRVGSAVNSPGAAAVGAALAAIHLARRHKTPLRLLVFLEDARSRHLLRTVGPVYQFRHATLQDRLAKQAPPGEPGGACG